MVGVGEASRALIQCFIPRYKPPRRARVAVQRHWRRRCREDEGFHRDGAGSGATRYCITRGGVPGIRTRTLRVAIAGIDLDRVVRPYLAVAKCRPSHLVWRPLVDLVAALARALGLRVRARSRRRRVRT